nr:MAG TPA: hypothetical protein [Caudoviricetes sp.]
MLIMEHIHETKNQPHVHFTDTKGIKNSHSIRSGCLES